jgi:hypothetical protein
MNVHLFILGLLGVWRITHLLHAEDGPGDMIVKLRRLAGDGVIGQAMDCFYCLSLWAAAPFALLIGATWLERLLLWPALSAGAIALDLALQRLKPAMPPVVRYAEDEPQPQLKQEGSHVQLWEITTDRGDNRDGAEWDVARGQSPASAVRVHTQVRASQGARHDV